MNINSSFDPKSSPNSTDPLIDNNNPKPFYTNDLVVKQMIYDNDISDLKRSMSIRNTMFIVSIFCNLICSLSLSANIIINIVQNMADMKDNLLLYQIISLSIFVFGLGINYFLNSIDSNLKNQQKNLLIKFGINSNDYNDQDVINFDKTINTIDLRNYKS
jgi:hypothetical protein